MIDDKQGHFSQVPELARLVTYSLFITILFGVIQVHFYYQLLLHVPIFHYTDTSEILLLSGSTGVSLMIYYIGINLPNYFLQQVMLNTFQKIVVVIIPYAIAGGYYWLAYRNDPIIKEITTLPLRYWWCLGFLVVFLIAFNDDSESTKRFMREHKIYQPMLLALWMGLFSGFAHYTALTTGTNTLKFTMKLKSGSIIKTNRNLIYAGRTNNYWFIYNRENQVTRVIRDDDVAMVDIDSHNY